MDMAHMVMADMQPLTIHHKPEMVYGFNKKSDNLIVGFFVACCRTDRPAFS